MDEDIKLEHNKLLRVFIKLFCIIGTLATFYFFFNKIVNNGVFYPEIFLPVIFPFGILFYFLQRRKNKYSFNSEAFTVITSKTSIKYNWTDLTHYNIIHTRTGQHVQLVFNKMQFFLTSEYNNYFELKTFIENNIPSEKLIKLPLIEKMKQTLKAFAFAIPFAFISIIILIWLEKETTIINQEKYQPTKFKVYGSIVKEISKAEGEEYYYTVSVKTKDYPYKIIFTSMDIDNMHVIGNNVNVGDSIYFDIPEWIYNIKIAKSVKPTLLERLFLKNNLPAYKVVSNYISLGYKRQY